MSTIGTLQLGAERGVARAICVLVHGRGQSPEEMQSLILRRLSSPEVSFFLPRAERGSWYDARAVDPLTSDARTQLAASIMHLDEVIKEARQHNPDLPLVLAGFSQGACLSLEYCFDGRPAPEALIALTGCRVGHVTDDRAHQLAAELPVYLTGSDNDPWIPVKAFAEAVGELGAARASLRADLFPGRAHEASDAEIRMLGAVLDDFVAGRAPRMEASR